jgi:hypothetical protein
MDVPATIRNVSDGGRELEDACRIKANGYSVFGMMLTMTVFIFPVYRTQGIKTSCRWKCWSNLRNIQRRVTLRQVRV